MAKAPNHPLEYRRILLSLIGDLTLADNFGDVTESMMDALKQTEIEIDWEGWDDRATLGDALGKMGVTTLCGSSLLEE